MCRPHFLKLISVQCIIRPCRATFPPQINSRACTANRHSIVKVSTSTHTRVRSLHSYNFIINTVWWSSILYLSRSLPLSNTIHLVVLSFNYG